MGQAMDGEARVGVDVRRVYAGEGDPLDAVRYVGVNVSVGEAGTDRSVFAAKNKEMPEGYSSLAATIIVAKYMRKRGVGGPDGAEQSMRQVVYRISHTLAGQALRQGVFGGASAADFEAELAYLMVNQYVAFNSPVWFNCGLFEEYGIRVGETGGWYWNDATRSVARASHRYERPQLSACMPYDVPVNTSEGLVPIGEIAERFRVDPGVQMSTWDMHGRPARIVAAVCNGKRYVMEFGLADGSALRMTSDHVVFVDDGHGNVTQKPAGDLEIGRDRLVASRSVLLPAERRTVIDGFAVGQDEAWAAGVMVGNGFSGRPPSSTSDTWEIKVNTRAEIDRIERMMEAHGVPFTTTDFHWGFSVRGYGSGGRAFWDRLDLWNKTGAKEVPAWVTRADAPTVAAFLRGLFDTDGTVAQASNGRVVVSVTNTSRQVIDRAQVLLRSLGVYASVSEYEDPRGDADRKCSYALSVCDVVSVERYAELVGFTHEGKASELAARSPDLEAARRAESVLVESRRKVGSALVYDIQTESETFWAGGLLVHNCFIQRVNDDLSSIFQWYHDEAMIFSGGGGSGTSLDRLRGSREQLSGGGNSSGAMTWADVADRAAGATKSGGTTRRAATMRTMRMDHPEIVDFITWKEREERKAQALMAAGYSDGMNGEAYRTVSGQNSNNSVRVTDAFMHAVEADGEWQTTMRTTGKVCDTHRARDLWRLVATSARNCADPGVQFDTVINDWHTVPNSGAINSSNPCCLVGETLVDTTEGRLDFVTLERMARNRDGLPSVYAFDPESRLPVIRPIRDVWVAGETDRLVEIRTQRGVVIRCTPDHRFLLRDGEYVEAQRLRPDDRLRKIGRSINRHRADRRSILHRPTEDKPNGNVWQNRFVWEQMEGEIPEGFHVHHKNEDPTDDRRSNLELRERLEHITEHATGSSNPRFLDADAASLIEAWDDAVAEHAADRVRSAAAFERMRSLRSTGLSLARVAAKLDEEGIRPMRGDSWNAASVHLALKQGHVGRGTDHGLTVGRWNSYIYRNGLSGVLPLANSRGIRGVTWEEFGAWVERERDGVNDRVESVKEVKLESPVKVYDLEVAGVHNFGVSSGDAVHSVVVHNSEFLFLDNTACNLASIRLTKFLRRDDTTGLVASGGVGDLFDAAGFCSVVRTLIIAQEAIVDYSSYPTEPIARNSHDFRPLGIGYADLGAMLMELGVPYDSNEGREVAAAITSLMTGHAYATSAELAGVLGPFSGFEANRDPMLRVIRKHRDAAAEIDPSVCGRALYDAVQAAWERALQLGELHGYRNAQVSLVAPTGTISFAMDCSTTGIEPDFALVKFKKLAGGGDFKQVNEAVDRALRRLGYGVDQAAEIVTYMVGTGTLRGAPHLNESFLRSKGLAPSEVERVEAALPVAFSLHHALSPAVLGLDAVRRLGLEGHLEPTSGSSSAVAWRKDFSLLTNAWGLSEAAVNEASDCIVGRGTVEGAPHLRDEHLPVFDCAARCGRTGRRTISPEGHVDMVAAVQRHLSGAVSKTINLPSDVGVDDIERVYDRAWRKGVKAVAVYPDGAKNGQPLSTAGSAVSGGGSASDRYAAALEELLRRTEPGEMVAAMAAPPEYVASLNAAARKALGQPVRAPSEYTAIRDNIRRERSRAKVPTPATRVKLPARRVGFTQEARIGGHKVFLRTGEYEGGQLGEIFIDVSKQGSATRAAFDALAVAVSVGLQHGVPPAVFVEKFAFFRCEPNGPVEGDARVRFATSIFDYIARTIGVAYCGRNDLAHVSAEHGAVSDGVIAADDMLADGSIHHSEAAAVTAKIDGDGTAAARPTGNHCASCGADLRRVGTCEVCINPACVACGTPTGGCS